MTERILVLIMIIIIRVWTIIIIKILVDKTNVIVTPPMSYEWVVQFRKCSVPRNHIPKRKR